MQTKLTHVGFFLVESMPPWLDIAQKFLIHRYNDELLWSASNGLEVNI